MGARGGWGQLTMQAACRASLSPAALGSHHTMWQRNAPGALAMMKAKERTSLPTPMNERNRTRHSHSTASVCRHSSGIGDGTGTGTAAGTGTRPPHLLVGDGEGGGRHVDHNGRPVLFAAGGQRRLQRRVDDVHAWGRAQGGLGGCRRTRLPTPRAPSGHPNPASASPHGSPTGLATGTQPR